MIVYRVTKTMAINDQHQINWFSWFAFIYWNFRGPTIILYYVYK